jgi:hypothetical protein
MAAGSEAFNVAAMEEISPKMGRKPPALAVEEAEEAEV